MIEYCGSCNGELCGHGRCERCDGPCPHHSDYYEKTGEWGELQ